jgi:hypothetical protein
MKPAIVKITKQVATDEPGYGMTRFYLFLADRIPRAVTDAVREIGPGRVLAHPKKVGLP